MEYLFNVELPEASELHDVLGFVDADFSMKQIQPYLRSSTKNIVEIIGENLYDTAVALYSTNTAAFGSSFSAGFSHSAQEHEFVTLLRYAIALGAFRQFAPLSDLSYTTSGRLFRTDDNTKSAFEWMIDKSDDAMERSYYAAVNEIIRFVLKELPEDAVGLTKKFKLDELFVYDLSVFQEYVNINDFYLLYFKLVPELRSAQNRLLKPRMGAKYDFFKANESEHINNLAKNICVFFAMKNGLRKESVQLWPRGVVRETSGSKKHQSASQIDIAGSVLFYDDELKELLLELENAIAKTNIQPGNTTLINFGPDDKFVTL